MIHLRSLKAISGAIWRSSMNLSNRFSSYSWTLRLSDGWEDWESSSSPPCVQNIRRIRQSVQLQITEVTSIKQKNVNSHSSPQNGPTEIKVTYSGSPQSGEQLCMVGNTWNTFAAEMNFLLIEPVYVHCSAQSGPRAMKPTSNESSWRGLFTCKRVWSHGNVDFSRIFKGNVEIIADHVTNQKMAGIAHFSWVILYDLFDYLESRICCARALLTVLVPGTQLHFLITQLLLVFILWKELCKILISDLDFGQAV